LHLSDLAPLEPELTKRPPSHLVTLRIRHIAAFAKALAAPDLSAEAALGSPTSETPPSSSILANLNGGASPPEQPTQADEPVEKLRAVSDFAPIHTRVKRYVR
jgi:hypothetical protein